jgi:CheY-like chemotaxis protein
MVQGLLHYLDRGLIAVRKPRKVLFVEDDDALRQVFEEKLRAEGFEVWTACDGLQGYSCYFRHPTDLVVTDIQMPELDGFQMMRCIRGINPSVKTVYVTGAAERFRALLEQEKQEFGAVIIEKPFSSEKLVTVIS